MDVRSIFKKREPPRAKSTTLKKQKVTGDKNWMDKLDINTPW